MDEGHASEEDNEGPPIELGEFLAEDDYRKESCREDLELIGHLEWNIGKGADSNILFSSTAHSLLHELTAYTMGLLSN